MNTGHLFSHGPRALRKTFMCLRWLAALAPAASVAAGCGTNEGTAASRWHPPIGLVVQIPASTIEVGLKGGNLRRSQKLAAFAISKTPVTRRQYHLCMDEGACQPPAWTEGPCAVGTRGIGAPEPPGAAAAPWTDTPATCVSPEQASAFCHWDGGRLPTTDEWALAARGPSVRRFAWGNGSARCDQSAHIAFSPEPGACCDKSCDDPVTATVGQHPAGASPFGVEDVLLTDGELVAAHADSIWGGCRRNRGACIVSGTEPGAIDAFLPMPVRANTDHGKSIERPVSFRCVYPGGAL